MKHLSSNVSLLKFNYKTENKQLKLFPKQKLY